MHIRLTQLPSTNPRSKLLVIILNKEIIIENNNLIIKKRCYQ